MALNLRSLKRRKDVTNFDYSLTLIIRPRLYDAFPIDQTL